MVRMGTMSRLDVMKHLPMLMFLTWSLPLPTEMKMSRST